MEWGIAADKGRWLERDLTGGSVDGAFVAHRRLRVFGTRNG
jgi:hypothetical protein